MKTCFLEDKVTECFSTAGNGQEHFFGYYDKSPIDDTGRRMLSHRVSFRSDRPIRDGDRASIVVWDMDSSSAEEVAATRAFNWQQGAMLQWLGPDFAGRIVFNDYRDGAYVSVILDLANGKERILPKPVYSISQDGRFAVCANYDRLFWCRPGYNYMCGGDRQFNSRIPKNDGIFLLDMESGEYKLIITTEQMAGMDHVSSMETGDNYLEHLLFSPNGERFFFFHRWQTPDTGIFTRAYTAARDGSDIRLLCGSGDNSHYAWRDNSTVLVYGSESGYLNTLRKHKFLVHFCLRPLRPLFKMIIRPDTKAEHLVLPRHFFLVDVDSGRKTAVGGGALKLDSHPWFCPANPDIFSCDSYQDKDSFRHLFLYDMKRERRIPMGKFFSPPATNNTGHRCDLHPRWDRQGKRICIDSLHSGGRQMHVFDVSAFV